jgi:DNA-binding response OmpR family regulator
VRVLLVDDCPITTDALAMLVKRWGHEVRVEHDGLAALDAARTYRPDVILLDLALPGLDGYKVARVLRRTSGLENTALVALTGFATDGYRRLAQEMGFDDYLVKPVEPIELERVLARRAEMVATRAQN